MYAPRKPFTLTELLIVFTILLILFALIQPMLVRGREKAEEVRCGNHFRQLNMIVQLYALDYRDFFPTYSFENNGVQQYNSIEYGAFLYFLRDYLPNVPMLLDSWTKVGSLKETIYPLPQPWLCPAYAKTHRDDSISGFRPTRQGMVLLRAYGFRGAPKKRTPAGHRISSLPTPSRYSLGAETGWEYDGTTEEEWQAHLTRPSLTRNPWFDGYSQYGHRQGWTVAFLDGHTRFLTKKRRYTTESNYGLRHRERVILSEDL